MRPFTRIAIGGLLCIACAAVALYASRLWLSTLLLRQLLEGQGLSSPELRVTALGPRHIRVRHIRLGEPPWLEVARLRAAYELRPGSVRLGSLAVEGARATLDLRPRDATAPPAVEGERAGAIPTVLDWLPERLQLHDASLRVLMPDGPLDVDVALELERSGDAGVLGGTLRLAQAGATRGKLRLGPGRLALSLRVGLEPGVATVHWSDGVLELGEVHSDALTLDATTVELPAGQLVLDSAASTAALGGELRIETARLRTASPPRAFGVRGLVAQLEAQRPADGAPDGRLTLAVAALTLPDENVEIRDARVELPLPPGRDPVVISHATLADLQAAPRFPVTRVSGSITPGPRPSWRIHADASALSAALRASVDASVNPDSGDGSATVELAPVRFRRGALQPVALHRALGLLQEVEGQLSGRAQLAWGPGGLVRSGASLRIPGASFRSGALRIENLHSAVELTSLLPLRSATGQELRADALLTGGVRFQDPRARFEVRPARPAGVQLQLDEASMRLGEGTLRMSNVLLDPAADTRDVTIHAEHFQLEELFRLLDVEGLSGTGRISGSIPVRIVGGAVEIRDGTLQSEGSGRLRIPPGLESDVEPSADEPLALVRRALADFHYERLGLTLSKPLAGTSSLRIDLLGQNPAVLRGQPLDLHINIETDLEPFLRAASIGLSVPGQWQLR